MNHRYLKIITLFYRLTPVFKNYNKSECYRDHDRKQLLVAGRSLVGGRSYSNVFIFAVEREQLVFRVLHFQGKVQNDERSFSQLSHK